LAHDFFAVFAGRFLKNRLLKIDLKSCPIRVFSFFFFLIFLITFLTKYRRRLKFRLIFLYFSVLTIFSFLTPLSISLLTFHHFSSIFKIIKAIPPTPAKKA